jgi:HSP20 family protein
MFRSPMFTRNLTRDLYGDFDRLQREMDALFDQTPSIRGYGRGGYPAVNVGSTPEAIEIYAFAPGLDPAAIEVQLERGVLTISGERRPTRPAADGRSTVHLNERVDGRFRRVVSLPEDADPAAVTADYRDGVLHVSVKRREASRPRRIEVQ